MELDRVALDLPSVGVPGSCSEGPADSGSLGGSSTSSYHCELAGNACAPGYPAVELVLDNPRGGVPSELQRWATDSDPWAVRAPARTMRASRKRLCARLSRCRAGTRQSQVTALPGEL